MGKSVPIGLSNVFYAVLTNDVAPTTIGGTDGYTAYDTPVRLLGAISATFSPNASVDTLFADDGPYETGSTLGAMTLELNVADLPSSQKAELLGATYDESTGILSHTSEDTPPWVAMAMSVKKSNGYDRYMWYLKGKFSAPDDNNQTKADSINWNTPTISGNFAKRDSDNQWKVQIDTDDPNVATATKETWFDSPNVGVLTKCAVPVASTASGALSKAVTTSITVTVASPAEAVIEYKLSDQEDWNTYSAGIATAGWAVGTVILNLRASKTGYAASYANYTYAVTA